MKCRTAKILLQDYIDGTLDGADTGMLTLHLQDCAACREDFRCTLDMVDMLKDIPVAPASAGFVDRALSNATRSRPATAGSRIKYMAAGIAAGLFAVAVTLSIMKESLQPQPDILLIGAEVKTIRVAIESARAIDDIEMTIDVSDNLEIEGYADQRVISWTTSLAEGVNLIRLPISAIAAGDGEIVARVGLGKQEKVYRIRTRHRADGNAGELPALAALEAQGARL